MRGSSFIYFIKDALNNIWKNKLMSIASVGVLTACMLIIGNSVLLSLNINNISKNIEDENEFVLFVKDEADQATLSSIEDIIKSNSNVETFEYISKEQAMSDYLAQHQEETEFIQGLEDQQILPASFKIKVRDISIIDKTVESLSIVEGVDSVRYNKDFIKKVDTLSNAIKIIAFWLVIVLAAVALFIVANTIKLAMFTRKKEINIMKFVGATNGFIRWPFFIEGLVLGAVSSIISIFIQWYVYVYLIESMINNIDIAILTPIPFRQLALLISLIFTAVGFVVGGIGSLLSIRKYIKV